MLELVVWIGVYTFALLGLDNTLRPWCQRRWFKVLLLPGTLLAAAVQGLAALIALGSVKKANFFRDGKPFLEVELARFPNFSSGLFVVSGQVFLFSIFLLSVTQLEHLGLLGAAAPTLPQLSLDPLLEGHLHGPYLRDSANWVVGIFQNPLVATLFLYVAVATFCSVRFSPREWRASTCCLLGVGALAYSGAWFGLGFRLFSRGWWANRLYAPDWWGSFSLFVTLAFLTLALTAAIRLFAALMRRLRWLHEMDRRERRSASTA